MNHRTYRAVSDLIEEQGLHLGRKVILELLSVGGEVLGQHEVHPSIATDELNRDPQNVLADRTDQRLYDTENDAVLTFQHFGILP